MELVESNSNVLCSSHVSLMSFTGRGVLEEAKLQLKGHHPWGAQLQRVMLPTCHFPGPCDQRETPVAERNGSLPMAILREALDIELCFSELLGRNSVRTYFRI